MSETKGVQEYYAAIRSRLTNYIKSDYLANSEPQLAAAVVGICSHTLSLTL